MDNVTHSVVGILVAEAALVLRGARNESAAASDGLRASALVVSVLANNAPDIDSAYASMLTKPLGSLLHHRGHTHTLVLAPLLGALAVAVALIVARARGTRLVARDRRWLFVLALAGVAIHIALDATNNYGVHPFWPFYDGWLYGDAVFIVEPLIWAALIPPLVFGRGARWLRVVLAAVVLLGVGLSWAISVVPPSAAFGVTALALATTLLSLRASQRARVLVSAGATGIVLVTFALSSALARTRLLAAAATSFPNAVTHDAVLTPMPANPLCWQALLVQVEEGRYVARSGLLAIAPGLIASDECGGDPWASPTAPSAPVPAARTRSLHWVRQFSAPVAELPALARESCVFRALLRFSRVPFWARTTSLGRVAGDLRYDRSSGLDFSDTALDDVGCPKHVPPWTPPRAELLVDR